MASLRSSLPLTCCRRRQAGARGKRADQGRGGRRRSTTRRRSAAEPDRNPSGPLRVSTGHLMAAWAQPAGELKRGPVPGATALSGIDCRAGSAFRRSGTSVKPAAFKLRCAPPVERAFRFRSVRPVASAPENCRLPKGPRWHTTPKQSGPGSAACFSWAPLPRWRVLRVSSERPQGGERPAGWPRGRRLGAPASI